MNRPYYELCSVSKCLVATDRYKPVPLKRIVRHTSIRDHFDMNRLPHTILTFSATSFRVILMRVIYCCFVLLVGTTYLHMTIYSINSSTSRSTINILVFFSASVRVCVRRLWSKATLCLEKKGKREFMQPLGVVAFLCPLKAMPGGRYSTAQTIGIVSQ